MNKEIKKKISRNWFKLLQNVICADIEKIEPVPLPDGGLPEGWSEEQWLHYGHQYLEMQESEDGQDEK